MRSTLAALALLIGVATSAFAQSEIALSTSSWSGGDFAVSTDPDPDLDSTAALGLMVSLDRGANRRLDFLYARNEGGLLVENLTRPPDDTVIGIDIDYLQVGGRVLFQPQTRIVPYIAMTVGATRFSPEEGGDTLRASGSLGAGVDLVVARSIALRLDGRWFATLTGGDVEIACGTECIGIGAGNGFNQFAASAGVVVLLP
jgi:hypothetical protein